MTTGTILLAALAGVILSVLSTMVRAKMTPKGAFWLDCFWTGLVFLCLPALLAIENYLFFVFMLLLFLIRSFLLFVDYTVLFGKDDER